MRSRGCMPYKRLPVTPPARNRHHCGVVELWQWCNKPLPISGGQGRPNTAEMARALRLDTRRTVKAICQTLNFSWATLYRYRSSGKEKP
jgi:hypothetical protein